MSDTHRLVDVDRRVGSGTSGATAHECHALQVWEETTAEKLTLVSEIDWLHFEPPVFVQTGETFWVEDRTLHVRGLDGSVRSVVARAPRPDDRR